MYIYRIPIYLIAMCRSVTLMEFSEFIMNVKIPEYQEDFHLDVAMRTINKSLMNDDFHCLPLSPGQMGYLR